MYAAAFLDHFQHPRRQGTLPGATHRGYAEDEACGDRIWLDLAVRDGTIADVRFRAEGCVGAIAAASALATLLVGRPADPAGVTRAEIAGVLEEVPRAKQHGLGLARRALRAALATPTKIGRRT